MKVLQFPLARITIGFIVGILFAFYFKPLPSLVFPFLFIGFCLFVIAYLISQKGQVHFIYFSLTAFLLSFFIGVTTLTIHTNSFQKSNYIHKEGIFDKPHVVNVCIREKLTTSNGNDRFLVIVNKIDDSLRTGRLLLNVQKSNLYPSFEIGTHLKIYGNLYPNSITKNPNQFDYGKYLENKQIYAQMYADATDIKVSSFLEKDIWYYTAKLRSKIIFNLEKSDFNATELRVAIALILGQKQEISRDLLRDYQYAGAIHILSVSGLHIGFILLFVNFLLRPFPNTRRGSFIKLIITLLSLSVFGLIAGLAPSVLRSVTMFSFVAIGIYLRRSTNVFHTLLVSMLLILLFEPSFLFDVGFQLSYLALFFILWLQPILAQLWKPKMWLLKNVSDILSVSFAAQLGTLPLSIYYFHQFPGLFFITNLNIIPFLSLIMALGVFTMIWAVFDSVPAFFVKSLEWSIYILDAIINSIASLEQFVFKSISFNSEFLLSVYLMIIATVFWLKKPIFNRLAFLLISIIIFQISYFKTHWMIQNEKELIVFHLKKASLIGERDGEKLVVFSNDRLLDTIQKNQLISDYLIGNFSRIVGKEKLENMLYYKGKKIMVLDSSGVYPEDLCPDIVVLTESPKINVDRMIQVLKPKVLVADGSNFKNIQKHWKASCVKEKIPFHATAEKGFYRLN